MRGGGQDRSALAVRAATMAGLVAGFAAAVVAWRGTVEPGLDVGAGPPATVTKLKRRRSLMSVTA